MTTLNLALWAVGVVCIAIGYIRAMPYLRRYQALRAAEDNDRRYESWRGRSRGYASSGPSSEALMAAELRRRVTPWALLIVAGIVLVFLGFAAH